METIEKFSEWDKQVLEIADMCLISRTFVIFSNFKLLAKGSIIKNRTTVAIWSGYIKEIEEFGGSHILKVKMSEKQWEHFHAHF